MSHPEFSPQQVLPTEIISLILRHVDDDAFLWVICRQLSHRMRAVADFLFRSVQLRNTIIYWPTSGMIATSPLLARLDFSHTSEDGDTVYFKVAIQNLKNTMFDFEASLKTYRRTKDTQKINGRGERQFGIMPVTRIGTEPNNTYMTDIALPALRMHRDTEHISFQWKELFAPIYQEEYRISVHKAAHDITSPSMMTLPTKFPIVIAAEFLHYHQRNGTEDSWIRTEVQRPRYRHLAPPDERPYGFASRKTFLFWKNIDDQLRNLEQYRDSVRLKELIAARGLRWIEIEGGWGWAEVPDF